MDRRRWHYLTRQPGFILRSVLLILLVGLGVAWFVGRNHKPHNDLAEIIRSTPRPKPPFTPGVPPPKEHEWENVLETIVAEATEFEETDITEAQLIERIRKLRTTPHLPPDLALMRLKFILEQSKFPAERKELFQQAIDSIWLNGPARVSAQAALVTATKSTSPTPRANELLGECAMAARDFPLALESYVRATTEAEPGQAFSQALLVCIRQKMQERLRVLLAKPGFETAWDKLEPIERNDGYLIMGDYWNLLMHNVKESWHDIIKAPAKSCVTLICGIVWFLMLHHLSGTRDYGLSLLAVALGMLSPAITLFCLTLQEHMVGLERNGSFVNDLIFFISGVGLREEVSKLLLFAPLLWFLRKKSDAVVLLTAGCVGLGFAIEENINYFTDLASIAVPRFVTANFLHIALTGMSGLALARWIRFPSSCWEQSLMTIISMVLLHGGYDFCQSWSDERGIFALNYFATLIMMLLAYAYCQELLKTREPRGAIFGPLWTFLVGVAVLAVCALVISSQDRGMEAAAKAIYGSGLGAALMIILFSYQLRDL